MLRKKLDAYYFFLEYFFSSSNWKYFMESNLKQLLNEVELASGW